VSRVALSVAAVAQDIFVSVVTHQQAKVELSAQVDSLRAQLARMQRLAAIGTMASMVVHEFNNILTPILSYAQLAGNGNQIMRDKAIRHAYEGSTRAAAICRALLGLSRSDDSVETVHVAELVNDTLTAMARDPAKDGITLVQKVPPKLALATRPGQVKQVLLNLLLNARAAVKAAGRGGSIMISADRRAAGVSLSVADTGEGIALENLERIFEPFFTTKGGEGTGLGLTICQQIAEGLGGKLTVRSQLGQGSCFTLHLPAKAARVPKTVK
jgi:two-component system NtrC family sensor kinase